MQYKVVSLFRKHIQKLNVGFALIYLEVEIMADSGMTGKALIKQRPKTKSDDQEQLDDLDFYMYPRKNRSSEPTKPDTDDDLTENFSKNPEIVEEESDDIIAVDDIEIFHSHNIDAEGNVKEFSIYDPDLPEDLEVGTSTAAKALHVTEQTIRNYCNDFSEFLDIRVINGRRKLSIKTLRKLDIIMQTKEERKYDREQMRAYLRNEGKETLMVTEAERMQALADTVSKKVIEELFDFFSGDNGIFSRMDAQSKQIGQMGEDIQKSLLLLGEKENEIKELADLISEKRQAENENNIDRISELEEKLDAVQKEVIKTNDLVRQKDEAIARLQQDNEMLRENANKKKWWFRKK